MAVVNTLATALSNADGKPVIFNNARVTRMAKWGAIGNVESVSGDNTGSTYRLLRIPSNARVPQVLLSNDALAGAAAGDVGLYQTADNGGAVVDADFFASAVSLVAAASKVDVTLESGVIDFANLEQPLWELLGLLTDPFVDYDVAVTLTADSAAAGSVTAEVEYGQ